MVEKTVKINSIQNLSDARYCAAMGVSLMGFKIRTDHYQEDLAFFKSVSEWVSGSDFVAEIDKIIEGIDDFNFRYLEISDINMLNKIPVNQKIIVNYTKNNNDPSVTIFQNNAVNYIVLDINKPKHFELLSNSAERDKILINTDTLTKNEIREIIKKFPDCGLCLSSHSESRPGFQEYDNMEEIFELLDID